MWSDERDETYACEECRKHFLSGNVQYCRYCEAACCSQYCVEEHEDACRGGGE